MTSVVLHNNSQPTTLITATQQSLTFDYTKYCKCMLPVCILVRIAADNFNTKINKMCP